MRANLFVSILFFSLISIGFNIEVLSPDEHLNVNIDVKDGLLLYSIKYYEEEMLSPSRLGLKSDLGDFTEGLSIVNHEFGKVSKEYDMTRTKASHSVFNANKVDITVSNSEKRQLIVTFFVANNNVAFRYTIIRQENNFSQDAIIYNEVSSFRFPDGTTTFISSHKKKPDYEEVFSADGEMGEKSKHGNGFVFPALFHIGNNGWALISETGVTSAYCASHLSDFSSDYGYTITFATDEDNNGIGKTFVGIPLPGDTPWRTITIGKTLKPIVETTISYDLVNPLYEPSIDYKPGRYTWSWLIWQDNSMNYDDQVLFIDLAANMGFEYVLVDALWDQNLGYEKLEELSKYAQSKEVRLFLWYNSNDYGTSAPPGPKFKMHNSIVREKEMAWMEKVGISGIKVDFFSGDKQVTMKLYEDILSDANRHGLQVIFHGCTLPRGWERLYPNFVASEAIKASEYVYFNEESAIRQPFDLTLHPFCRNAIASMDWGGIIMNRYLSRDNKSSHSRKTTDVFEMASGIIMQTSVQCVAIQPNNYNSKEIPDVEIEFLKELPTTWDETIFIDGYPGKYVVLARKHESKWYVAGLNAEKEDKELLLELPMFKEEKTVNYYSDDDKGYAILSELKVDSSGKVKVIMKPNGGFILK